MKTAIGTKTAPNEDRLRRSVWVTVICDAVLLVAFVICLLIYVADNNTKAYNQNIESITGIAEANSRLVQNALDQSGDSISRTYKYCRGKSVSEIMEYLSVINDKDDEYQLLKYNTTDSTETFHVYEGFSTKKSGGEFLPVEYRGTAISDSIFRYSSQAEGTILLSQSFTNNSDALRYFAVFCGISVSENGGTQKYYLVKLQKESIVLDQTQKSKQYSDISIAVCYIDGKYIACDSNFRGENFFDYIYKYNGLSIDERDAIRTAVQQNNAQTGVLNYQNYQKEDCVFAYSSSGEDNNWLVVVAVPESEFSAEKLISTFPLIVIAFLTVLLFFNIYRLLMIVGELRRSVVREQIANASKSSFLSRMSHEIRTPLNAVIGYNTIARNEMAEAKSDEEIRQAEMKVMDCLTKSDIASKHLLTVINDVLDMSAIEGGKIKIANERFDFRGLVTSLTTVFYSQAKAKGVEFEVLFNTLTEEWFVGDQMRVNQVLANLLSNAVKFTADGGIVRLVITQPNADTDASHIHFEVSDTGIGMTSEYISHIWTAFEQEDSSISRRFGGSGLGLSIAKNLVDLMGGTIKVESKQGVGTTFFVDLTFGRTKQEQSTSTYDFENVNALVVDDDASTCDYVRLLFNRCGAKCAAATSGEDAITAMTAAKQSGNKYTVCLVDWQMPRMDGIETVEEIRNIAGNDMPIIVLTAYDYTEIADKAKKAGVDRFISKPLFQSSLFDLLANVSGTKLPDEAKNQQSIDFGGAHILLAEDNAMNMEIASMIMRSVGLLVDEAWNGKEAVDLYESSPPGTYKAILMDVHMPEMNGHEATHIIRESSHEDAKTIPIIAMTADAFAENVAEAHEAGMNEHISKPIDVPTLFEILKKYIN